MFAQELFFSAKFSVLVILHTSFHLYFNIFMIRNQSLFKTELLPLTTLPQNPHFSFRVQTSVICLSVQRGKNIDFKMHDRKDKLSKTILVSQQK